MGAEEFETIAAGPNAEAAFNAAVQEAYYEYGHRGYTGSIAEKDSAGFVTFNVDLDGVTADELYDHVSGMFWGGRASEHMDWLQEHGVDLAALQRIYDDKWGPAACFPLGGQKYLFCGLASS